MACLKVNWHRYPPQKIHNHHRSIKINAKLEVLQDWLAYGIESLEKFNCYNQCVDNGELKTFCGTVARNPALTLLEYSDWRKVPLEKKDELWTMVKVIPIL
ncbi:hypothetical protein LINPERPRIM_LOCUS22148 [Linum perenne]